MPVFTATDVRPEADESRAVRQQYEHEWVGLLPIVLVVLALVLLAWGLAWTP